MNSKVKYDSWSITVDDLSYACDKWASALFFLGNGHAGIRNHLPLSSGLGLTERGIFIEGVFEYIRRGITDMVNLPDPFDLKLSAGGTILTSCSQLSLCSRSLDLRKGILTTVLAFGGREFRIEQFASHHDRNIAGIRVSTAAYPDVSIEDSFCADVANMPVSDDQKTSNEEVITLIKDAAVSCEKDGIMSLSFSTVCGTHSFTFTKKNRDYICDGTLIHESLVSFCGGDLSCADYEEERDKSAEALSSIWQRRDILMEGASISLQCALRFNIFQLIQNAPSCDISIGARGLTHGRYKGCYFWDTDVFLLPYYLLADRSVAEHLARYRIRNLDAARRVSASLNTRGARYPWMASLDGSEQCESWDTGKCEMHISADVAWALSRYDAAFDLAEDERRAIAEVYAETARFWLSRFTYSSERDCYDLIFVKGPDEYCGVTSNNAYTNHMAILNVRLALKACDEGLIRLEDGEREKFSDFILKVRRPYSDRLGTILEDDNYLNLEDVDLSVLKESDKPLYWTYDYDTLQRLRVLKQPDVLLLYLMQPSLFTVQEAERAWDEYEARCAHDSTLSWPLHALIAYKLGKEEEAWKYLHKSLFLDLENLMQNTHSEGLHIGAMGASLEAVLYGMLGHAFSSDEKTDRSPQLPECVSHVSYCFLEKGEFRCRRV